MGQGSGVYRVSGIDFNDNASRSCDSGGVDDIYILSSPILQGEDYVQVRDCDGSLRNIQCGARGGYKSGSITITKIANFSCVVASKFDCINGSCVDAKTYNTPGFFTSQEECQKVCAFSCEDGKQCVDPNTFCPPGKVCLESSEYSESMSRISALRDQFCK